MILDKASQPAWIRGLAWIASLSLLSLLLILLSGFAVSPLAVNLLKWSPALAAGLLVNIRISVLAIAIGTFFGLIIGALQLSPLGWLRMLVRWYIQLFRNTPVLVLIYFASYVFPFEIHVGTHYFTFPDWIKVTLGLALPASANVAEIFRGAVLSIPTAQWDAANSLAFGRRQILSWIIFPQCVRRMLPPWMNLYAMITMSTALASLVGVNELLDTAQIASNTVNRVDFTVAIYFGTLLLFFIYCYPISRLTQYLEKIYAFI
jgi:polar amino acid transport system permease protein